MPSPDSIGSFAPPRGMRDFYPEDMAVRNAIFDAWSCAARQFGFVQYDACVVESLDLLKRKGGEEIVDQIYAFADKSGRDLALRAEMTPTLARMVAARQAQLPMPLKWFAIAQCFRYERMSRGRKREHFQLNLDVIGEDSLLAEAEVISAAIRALETLGLGSSEVQVHVSSRALLAELLERSGISREHHPAVFLALDKRGKMPDEEIGAMLTGSGLGGDAIAAAFRLMAIRTLDEARAALGPGSAACRDLDALLALLAAQGNSAWVRFDISVIRGLGYYTGAVFEAFDVGRKFRAIFGGGRYNNLLGDLGGKAVGAVGLGFGDVVVAELLAEAGKVPSGARPGGMVIGFMEEAQQATAVAVASALRRSGRAVDLGLRAEKAKAFFSRAGRSGMSEAVFIGPDDVARGTLRLKQLDTRSEREVPLELLLREEG